MPPENAQPNQPERPNLDLVGSDALPGIREDRQSEEERKELFGEPKRREELRQLFHEALVLFFRATFLLFLVVLVIRVLHFILPENNMANAGKWLPHGWLTDSQLGSIDKFSFGALGTLVAQYIRVVIARDRKDE